MRKFLVTLACLSVHICARAADPAAAPVDFSQFKTPEEILTHVQSELQKAPSKDPAEMTVRFERASDALANLVQRFPDSSEAWQARSMKIQFDLVAAQLARRPAPAGVVEEANAILSAPGAPESARQSARIILVQNYAISGPVADFEKQVDLYEKDYQGQPLPGQIKLLLARQLQSTNPDKAKKIEAEVAKGNDERAAAQAAAQARMNELLNKPLPIKFTAVDGREIDLTRMQGKVVLVDFWATWCGPCMQEVPALVELYKKNHDKGFEIVGISLDQDKDQLLNVTKARGMTWPQYFDGKREIASAYGITSIPQMWLINKQGKLVSLDARQDLEGQVEKLLAE